MHSTIDQENIQQVLGIQLWVIYRLIMNEAGEATNEQCA